MSAAQREHDLGDVLRHVKDLLKKQEVVAELVDKQEMHRHDIVRTLVQKQQSAELAQYLHRLHPADLAHVLESLPQEARDTVWRLVRADRYGSILLEVGDALRRQLIESMGREALLSAAGKLDSDEIAYLVPDLPQDVARELLASLTHKSREQVQSVLSFPADSVGALMDFDMLVVQAEADVGTVTQDLRRRKRLPPQSDKLFVVDADGHFQGVLPMIELLTHDAAVRMSAIMHADTPVFDTRDAARAAALAFQRYDLISAPVVNAHGQLVGRLSVDEVVQYYHDSSQKELLHSAGLSEAEDLFAPVWQASRNRWAWLALNLVTAFVASRVIGLFEGTIQQLVALAALMPIVANIGGNTGNQTAALIIRGLALNQIAPETLPRLLRKELLVSLLNGLLWGSVVALFSLLLYGNLALAAVLLAAMVLTLGLASLAGLFIPIGLKRIGRDPVMGSSVLLTALTDSGGFFIFLGLAAWWLV